jgi:hypothetical protein
MVRILRLEVDGRDPPIVAAASRHGIREHLNAAEKTTLTGYRVKGFRADENID